MKTNLFLPRVIDSWEDVGLWKIGITCFLKSYYNQGGNRVKNRQAVDAK